ncbi:hypothetical protein GCM10009602_57050 [Nocardiopsis tropica]
MTAREAAYSAKHICSSTGGRGKSPAGAGERSGIGNIVVTSYPMSKPAIALPARKPGAEYPGPTEHGPLGTRDRRTETPPPRRAPYRRGAR